MADHTKPEVDLRQDFGHRLAIVRKLRGFSQEQLASISGLERSRISGIERGKANLTLNNIGLLAQALSVAPVELMDFHSQTVNEFKFAEPIENPKHDIGVLFCQRLIIVRKLRGYSQEQLAAESGIARSHVSAIERGKINISLNKIGQIAQTLSVDPRELMDFDSETVSELNEGDEVPESPIEAVDPESSSFQ